ncbi:hypothetical protein [Corynebacterium glaucum]|uniref:hypothetical protein n=1 Tax=Corynebacterium glaucum TaxID=187491 RepID=UPI00265ADA39|nr:hypothetical protein [Corynebacterium glaucum]
MSIIPNRKRIAAGVAAVLAAVSLTACSSDSSGSSDSAGSDAPSVSSSFRDVDAIKEDGTVKIGVFSDKAPFGYVDANGGYAGYDIEYGNRLG